MKTLLISLLVLIGMHTGYAQDKYYWVGDGLSGEFDVFHGEDVNEEWGNEIRLGQVYVLQGDINKNHKVLRLDENNKLHNLSISKSYENPQQARDYYVQCSYKTIFKEADFRYFLGKESAIEKKAELRAAVEKAHKDSIAQLEKHQLQEQQQLLEERRLTQQKLDQKLLREKNIKQQNEFAAKYPTAVAELFKLSDEELKEIVIKHKGGSLGEIFTTFASGIKAEVKEYDYNPVRAQDGSLRLVSVLGPTYDNFKYKDGKKYICNAFFLYPEDNKEAKWEEIGMNDYRTRSTKKVVKL
jgi:HD-GYP domain-containing protein (c-di-GMP phosphodiesterase class II)